MGYLLMNRFFRLSIPACESIRNQMDAESIYSNEQAKNTMQLLDLAVKAGGLNASVLALPIAQAIEGQLTDQKEK